MLMYTHVAVAGRCPECSATAVEEVSLFQIDRRRMYSLQCSCGTTVLRIEKKNKQFTLQVECYVCGDLHSQRADTATMCRSWRQIICPFGRLEVACVGNAVDVYDLVSAWQPIPDDDDEVENEEFFTNPEVMYDILEYVQELSESRRIVCPCGVSDLDLEVGAGHISLRCPRCKALYIVPATSVENLQQFLDSPPEWVRPRRGRYDRSPR